MPSFGLYRTCYPHFMTTFTINDITCTIFIPWHALYMTSHLLCMMSHSLFVTSHNEPIYGIKHYMFMLYSLDMASGTVLWPQNHYVPSQPLCLALHSMYFWHYTQCTNFLKRSECMSSQPLYVWHHMQYIWHHIHSLWRHTIEVIPLHPLHAWHRTPNIWHNTYGNTNVISDICPNISNTTSTVSVSSNPAYQLYHTHTLYDITHYTCDIIFSMHAITTV